MTYIAYTMEKNLGADLLRMVFSWIDWVVYNLISILMQAIFDIANFQLSESIFEKFTSRVYLILAIFMLFKVIISLLTYFANPDTINDKEKGASKLVTRIIVAMVMLVMLPNFFSLMYRVQEPILQTLPRFFLGVNSYSTEENNLKGDASKISWSIFRGFFNMNPDCVGYQEGGDESLLEPIFTTSGESVTTSNAIDYAVSGMNKSCGTDEKMYQYEYSPIVSTLAGGFMCYCLIGISITIAIRMFKLIILRMIAPIAIISYVDPKSSKNNGTFSSWAKTLGLTWAELFLNLAIMYLIIFLIKDVLLNSTGEVTLAATSLGWRRGTFFTIIIILGLFMFALQAPKFLFDALGIKSKGSFIKALGMSTAALSGLGATVGATGAALKKGGLSAVTAPLTGVWTGLRSAGTAGNALITSDKPTLTTGMDASKKYMSGAMNDIRAGRGLTTKLWGTTKSAFGYDIDADINHLQSIVDSSDKLMSYAMGEGAKKFSNVMLYLEDENKIPINATRNDILSAIAKARANGTDVEIEVKDSKGNVIRDAAGNALTYNLGSVDGSNVAKISGDANEMVGDVFMQRYKANHAVDTSGGMKNLITTYSNAMGISENISEDKIITGANGIKKDKKSTENELFTRQQEKGKK